MVTVLVRLLLALPFLLFPLCTSAVVVCNFWLLSYLFKTTDEFLGKTRFLIVDKIRDLAVLNVPVLERDQIGKQFRMDYLRCNMALQKQVSLSFLSSSLTAI